MARIDTRKERIRAKINELEKWTMVMTKEIKKYNNLSKLQDSADATKDYSGEMNEKYTQRIQLLDESLEESSSQHQQKVGKLERSSVWKEVQALKSKLCSQGQDLFELQQEAKTTKAGSQYGNIKADCLLLIDEVQEKVKHTFK